MKKLLIILLANCAFLLHAQVPFFYAPEIFDPKISSGLCGFSTDGKTIFFVREDTVQKKLFLFQARWKNKRWGDAQLMPFSGKHNDMGGRLTKDGNTFYFTSDRPGGSDKPEDTWNIWVTTFSKGVWSDPKPLKDLNNKGMECCPLPIAKDVLMFSGDRARATSWWITSVDLSSGKELFLDSLNGERLWQWPSSFADENTLLLNSMGRKEGLGQDDIYISFRTKGVWSKPVNLGPPVNSKVYEDGAMLTPDKKYLLFLRHQTHETPSQVMAIEWQPVLKRVQKAK